MTVSASSVGAKHVGTSLAGANVDVRCLGEDSMAVSEQGLPIQLVVVHVLDAPSQPLTEYALDQHLSSWDRRSLASCRRSSCVD